MRHLTILFAFALVAWSQSPKPGVIVQNGTGGGGESGTVTSVATGCGLSGGTITATGTIVSRSVANAQTGTTYTLDATDCGKLVTLSNGAAITLTIPAAGGSFVDGWYVDVQNIGAGTATCSGATCTLTTGQSARFVSTGATWRVLLGGAGAGGTYTAGTGLTLAGSEFAINTAVTARKLDMQSGAPNYCRSTTGNDTYTCTLTPTLTAYTTGGCLVLNPDTANTLTATVNVDTLGAKSILNRAGAALSTGDITANAPITICYDGTQYIIQGDGGGASSGTIITQQLTVGYGNGNGGAPPHANNTSANAMTNGFPPSVALSNTGTPVLMWSWFVPSNWNSGQAINVTVSMTEKSGNTGTYQLRAALRCLSTGTTYNSAFSTGDYNTSSSSGLVTRITGNQIQYATMSSLDTTGCDPGEMAYLAIWRDNSVGTLAGAIDMVFAAFEYGVN